MGFLFTRATALGRLGILATSCLLSISCATSQLSQHLPRSLPQSLNDTRPDSASEALQKICQLGTEIESVRGNLWLKIKSKEVSGQFSGRTQANSEGMLDLELLNFLGGTEATVKIRSATYEIFDAKNHKTHEGMGGVWAGLPMRWASDLFLGKTPCPNAEQLSHSQVSWEDENNLRVSISQKPEQGSSLSGSPQEFRYRVTRSDGGFRAQGLRWEGPTWVEFRFSDPEVMTLSPKKWEVHSARGDLKIRWRDREVQQKGKKIGEATSASALSH